MDRAINQPENKTRRAWNNYHDRQTYVKQYSWAIPTKEVINKLVELSPLIEIGAGTGYWASLVNQAKGEIFPFDQYLGLKNTYKHTMNWIKINQGGPGILKETTKEINLFLCWPPYAEPMAIQCLNFFNGNYICYIGEGSGGCTACDQFHTQLERQFILEEEIFIPQWSGIHDSFYIYRRRTKA